MRWESIRAYLTSHVGRFSTTQLFLSKLQIVGLTLKSESPSFQYFSQEVQKDRGNEGIGFKFNIGDGFDGCDVVHVSGCGGGEQPPPSDPCAGEWRKSAGSKAYGGIQAVELAVQPTVSAGEGQRRVVQAVVRPSSSRGSVHPMLCPSYDALL